MAKKIFIITTLLAGILFSNTVLAAGLTSSTINLGVAGSKTGLSGNFGVAVSSVVAAILAIVGVVFLIMVVYAGILWMTAAGKSEQAEKGQHILAESVIGLVITLAAFAITNFVGTKLGSAGVSDSGDGTCRVFGGTCKTECSQNGETARVTSDCVERQQYCCVPEKRSSLDF